MTASYPDATERVLALLPAHVRNRDAASGGLLRALIEAVAAELAVLEADLDELYASWFAETCPEWVVPYLADLLGVEGLPPEVSTAGVSRRAFVANTVAYRRRKGTPAAAEQVARDATGWPARAVEYHRLLATATHTQHVRLDRPATASLRTRPADGGPLELVPRAAAQGALDPVAHTAEVRRIASGAGRYGIGNLGVYLFPDLVGETGWAPPVVAADGGGEGGDGGGEGGGEDGGDGGGEGGWAVHPLGYATPLYAPPSAETAIEHLATEADLPVPLRPRRLLALLAGARIAAGEEDGDPGVLAAIRDALPAGVRIGGQDLDPVRLRVCGLEDLARDGTGRAPLAGWQVAVDTVRGRLFPYRDGKPATPSGDDGFLARHCYGATAEVGAGCYDRTAVHQDAVAADPYRGDPARGGPGVVAQRLVLAGDQAGPALPGIAEALATAGDDWAADGGTGGAADGAAGGGTGGAADGGTGGAADGAAGGAADGAADGAAGGAAGGAVGGSYVIAVGDSGTYAGGLRVHIPAATRLILAAATIGDPAQAAGPGVFPGGGAYATAGLRPLVRGSLTVTGEGGSSLVVDGLVIGGDLIVDDGLRGSLTISQCTVAGRVVAGRPDGAGNPGLAVRLVRAVAGPVSFGSAAASLEVLDSVVDAGESAAVAGAGAVAVAGPGLALTVTGSTVRGRVAVRTLEASSSILDGHAAAEHRQTGCVRYCYVRPGSSVPRRFRCVPGPGAPPPLAPVYAATDPGSPHYLALARYGPVPIAAGGEGGSEMGVHHHLGRPVRLAAAAGLLGPYLPAGMQLGVVAPLAPG